ncbi:hypothetical protein LF844_23100 [Metapseudomonas lalkuanensis]|uniref:hypothetical protein n=1 Tax=Metapseudomonas lalkuanensis TaxID=2604832 RepID=UPI001CF504A2|nr:hypothetical protein [Pseudomonas lalkuanensis]UCO97516.1 hypothetical protein LF844_23100 [Pseudomonas lalkuanensis]
MKQSLTVELRQRETTDQTIARTMTSPECLSASVLTICQNIDRSQINEMVIELKQQTAAIHADDLSRAESMLTSQAHTLDGLFAKMASKALTTSNLDVMERYMRLALKAQNQARATLQTLGELKAPKQISFVKQANIGNQVQVNNDSSPARTRAKKSKKAPNELLEVEHGKRLDTRAAGAAGGAGPAMAPVGEEHRAGQCGGKDALFAECLERWC